MSVQATTPRRTQQSASFAELFTPKLDAHMTSIVDFVAVPFLDSTGANVIEGLARKSRCSSRFHFVTRLRGLR